MIANLKTVIAVLQYNKIDDEINKHILEDILCCLRLYVGQKHDLGSSNDSNSVSDKEKQSEIEKHSKSGIDRSSILFSLNLFETKFKFSNKSLK